MQSIILSQAIDSDPDSAVRHAEFANYLDLALDLKLRDRMRALKHAKNAVELDPENAVYRAVLGRIYWTALGDRMQALREIDRALELEPNSPRALEVAPE